MMEAGNMCEAGNTMEAGNMCEAENMMEAGNMCEAGNMLMVIGPDQAANSSTTVQRLLGCGVMDGTFSGHVDGRVPIKLIPTRDRVGRAPVWSWMLL